MAPWALTVTCHVCRREATEGVAPGSSIGMAGHGAHHCLQVLLLFQAAGVSLGLTWEGESRQLS